MGKDVIVIGGGLGGLVSACLLAKEGYKVTVLERHYKIGGGLHCFKWHGVNFETGIHYVSGFQDGGTLKKIFSYLDIDQQLDIKNLDTDGFDIIYFGEDKMTYPFAVGKENFVTLLSEKFPGEKENIQRYIDSVYDICDNFYLFNLEPLSSTGSYFQERFLMPLGEFLESFTENRKLSSAFASTSCLYAGDKETTPCYIHALITKFYIEGASRFVGGSQQLADAMTNFIQTHGGTVLTSSGVTEIEVQEKNIQKVITSDGREFLADYYISDIHPSLLLDMIDPTQIQRSYRDRLHTIENSYSSFTIYIILKPNTFPFLNHNFYYHPDYENVWKLNSYDEDTFPRGFMLTTPPEKDQSEFAEKIIVNCVMNFEDVKKWENTTIGNRGKDYENFKKKLEEKVISQIEEIFPTIKSSIKEVFSATPLTIRDYTGSKNGSLYGYKKDCRDMILSQVSTKTKVQNLLLTGQNINLHGIIGVPLNAIVTVGEFVGINNLINKINEAYNQKTNKR